MKSLLTPGNVLLLSIAFAMGFCVMSLEMLGGRYLSPYFGSSIDIWGAIIGSTLGALTIGYFMGGYLADKYPSPRFLAMLTIPAALMLAILPLFVRPIADGLSLAIENYRLGGLIASCLILCPPLVFMSTFSPFIVRLLLKDAEDSGKVSGAVYGISNVGSIVGTLFTTFFWIPSMGSRNITFCLALAVFGCILALLLLVKDEPEEVQMDTAGTAALQTGRGVGYYVKVAVGSLIFLVLFVVSLSLAGGPAAAQSPVHTPMSAPLAMSESATAQGGEAPELLEYVESPYNTIIVLRQGEYVTMQFGYRNKRWTESRANPADPTELSVDYTQLMTVGTAYADKLEQMAMIGVGGGTTSRYLTHYMPDTFLDAVEIDGDVIKLALEYFGLEERDNLGLHARDGRLFLRRSDKIYDVIMVDAYRGWYVPFHLLTTEFYQQVEDRLSDGGVLVQNIEPSTMLFDAAIATLKTVFDHVELYDAGGNIVAVAYSGPEKDAESLMAQAEKVQAEYGFRYSVPELLSRRMPLNYDETTRALTDDFAPANVLHNRPR